MKESLSIREARKLVLLSQRLTSGHTQGRSKDAILADIEHLGYVQIDTISVIQRAHHHTLWNRNPRYKPSHLEQLVDEKQVFEYWAHAASYLPMRDYRFTLRRKNAFTTGLEDHWYDRDEALEKSVLKRITEEGPLMAKDFEPKGERTGDWKTKPTKRALETLLMQGDLMSARRINFQKVYDLTERVIPSTTNTTTPTEEEQARFLVRRFLRANGIGLASEVAYLLKGTKPFLAATMQEMLSAGELISVEAGEKSYFAIPESLDLLNRRLNRQKAKILSPFDNLVIQRKRMQELFEFDYLIECYLPAAKRRHGYFALPILWNGKLAARMDCKAERKESRLHIHHLALEPWLKKPEAFFAALAGELKSFLTFNHCSHVIFHGTYPAGAREALQIEIGRN